MRAPTVRIDIGDASIRVVTAADAAMEARFVGAGELLPTLASAIRAAGVDGAAATVLVEAVHARLLLLPWADALQTEKRWRSYAESMFEAAFGHPVDGWSLRVIAERPGRPRLATALPVPLLRAVEQSVGRGLRSVRIDAMTRLDSLRHLEPRFSGAVVDVGHAHTLLSLMHAGALRRVRLRRMAQRTDELVATVRMEWAALASGEALPALAVGPGTAFDAAVGAGHLAAAPRIVRLH